VLEFVTSSLLKKLLHLPSVKLREASEKSDQAFIEHVRDLFGLEPKDEQ
jgi:glutamyl-tRNA reductase